MIGDIRILQRRNSFFGLGASLGSLTLTSPLEAEGISGRELEPFGSPRAPKSPTMLAKARTVSK